MTHTWNYLQLNKKIKNQKHIKYWSYCRFITKRSYPPHNCPRPRFAQVRQGRINAHCDTAKSSVWYLSVKAHYSNDFFKGFSIFRLQYEAQLRESYLRDFFRKKWNVHLSLNFFRKINRILFPYFLIFITDF